jgi:hypothetical protein
MSELWQQMAGSHACLPGCNSARTHWAEPYWSPYHSQGRQKQCTVCEWAIRLILTSFMLVMGWLSSMPRRRAAINRQPLVDHICSTLQAAGNTWLWTLRSQVQELCQGVLRTHTPQHSHAMRPLAEGQGTVLLLVRASLNNKCWNTSHLQPVLS